jgi:hypothetical protein
MAPKVEMGGTGLEPVTPSLSKRSRRSLAFARVRLSLQISDFRFEPFARVRSERTLSLPTLPTDFVRFRALDSRVDEVREPPADQPPSTRRTVLRCGVRSARSGSDG